MAATAVAAGVVTLRGVCEVGATGPADGEPGPQVAGFEKGADAMFNDRSNATATVPTDPAGETQTPPRAFKRGRPVRRLAAAVGVVGIGLTGAGLATSPAAHSTPEAQSTLAAQSALAVHSPSTSVTGSHNPPRSTTTWSGYAAYNTTFRFATAQWNVPQLNCSWGATGASSTWVGLDGYGGSTVEQLGTRQNCLWGFPSYYAWFEMFPAGEQALPGNDRVRPGDSMSAFVDRSGASFLLSMSDATAGWSWSSTVAAPSPMPSALTAEWIMERPSCVYECTWLPNFGSVKFRHAVAGDSTISGPISDFTNDALTMVNSSGSPEATPSPLWSDTWGDTFDVTYDH